MKAWNSFFELVIVMVFVLVSVPLLISLVYAINRSKFNYLDDKTIYQVSPTNEMFTIDEHYYPLAMLPVHTDFGGSMVLPLIQDNYCPQEARNLVWAITTKHSDYPLDTMDRQYTIEESNKLDAGTLTNADEIHEGFVAHQLTITGGYEGIKYDLFNALINSLDIKIFQDTYMSENRDMYFVYNYTNDKWMLTAQQINALE